MARAVDDEHRQEQSDGESSDAAQSTDRSTDQGPNAFEQLCRTDTAVSIPLNKPSTLDGVLGVNPVPYRVWAHNADMTPPKSAPPLKKSGSGWHLGHLGGKLSWSKPPSRKTEKEKITPNDQKSPLTSLFSRLRR
jgi:hypothetical protein